MQLRTFSMGEVVEIEGQPGRKFWCLPFIRVKVMLDSSKPLPVGYSLPRNENDVLWIKFRIERIVGFCYVCGMLGHMQFFVRWLINRFNLISMGHG